MRTEDGYIIQQCLDGNSATFAFLVDKYKSSVYALAYSEIHNFHDAQDITQEVFIKAFKNLHTLKRWDSFMGWLCRITINTCKNWVRSASRRPDSEFFEDQAKTFLGNRALESYQKETVHRSIREALDSLPQTYCQVLTLRYFSGMTVKEISSFLGISPRTVDRRIGEAQARLKEEILDMMKTTKEQYNLPANFTFRIIEIVKNIRANPIPQIKSLPWGFSLALGFVAIVLGFGAHINFQYIADRMSSSSSITESSLPKSGEYSIKMVEKAKMQFNQGHGDKGLSSMIPNPINALFFAAQPGKGQTPRESDLVVYLSMDGGSDAEALQNQMGKDVKAVKHGDPKWKSSGGHDGKGAFEFDGDDDISLGNNFPTRSSYTKTAWIYWTGNGGIHAGNNIISGDENENGHAFWCPEAYGNKLSAGHNAHWDTVQDKKPLQRNRWYFVSLTYDRSSKEMVLYKDAVAVSRAKVSDSDRDVADPTISIGSFGEKNGWMFQGLIDDVRIYRSALNDNEIRAIFEDRGTTQQSQEPPKSKDKSGSFIVWESNRTGQWELYRANIDGSDRKQIAELAKIYPLPYSDYLRPRISPDGKTVLFGYGKKSAPVEVWVVSSTGGQPRKLTNGNPLNWSPDGKLIYFVRNSQIWQYNFRSGKESVIYDKAVSVDGKDGSMVGDIRRDLKAVVLRSEKSNEFFDFDKAQTVKTTGGCEPSFSSDGRYMYWVNGPKDFWVWDMQNNEEHQFLGTPDYANWNYTYFPRVSTDSRWIVYGASPNQHDHNTSDYEIFVQELRDWKPIGKPIRITNDPRTDRWGTIWLAN